MRRKNHDDDEDVDVEKVENTEKRLEVSDVDPRPEAERERY